MIRFIPRLVGAMESLAIFICGLGHSNADFDNFGGDGMMCFQTDWLVNMTLSAHIITGGAWEAAWSGLTWLAVKDGGLFAPYQGSSLVGSLRSFSLGQ